MLDRETLLAELRYEPETGLVYRRILRGPAKQNAGRPLSTVGNHGYIVASVRREKFLLHRAIWVMVHGSEPEHIDHIDGDRTNNRLTNLRSVSQAQNNANGRRVRRNSRSGVMGVSFHPETGKYRARRLGKSLGLYATASDASDAYWSARNQEGP